MSGVLSPIELIILLVINLGLLIYSLVLILRKENGWLQFAWIIFVLVVPIIGPIIYLAKNFINPNG